MGLGRFNQARHSLPFVVLAALACRLLIPAGYMPAPLGDGGPIQLCSFGVPSGSGHDDHHDHHGSHDPHGNHELAWEHCPFGVLLSVDAVDVEPVLATREIRADATLTAYRRVSSNGVRTPFRARAPPLTSLI